jgi:uncharacterized repeat protein (TIGR01451 family)
MKTRLFAVSVLLVTGTWLALILPNRIQSVAAHRTAPNPIARHSQVTAALRTASTAHLENTTPSSSDADYYDHYLAIGLEAADEKVTRAAMTISSPNALSLPDGMQIFYGDLHSHTGYSDGKDTPEVAFQTARNNGLDFFAVTDHAFMLDDDEWNALLAQAKAATADDEFVALAGYEWTSNNGHANVFNTDRIVRATDLRYDSVKDFYAWLSEPPQVNTVAQFNHPYYPPYGFDYLAYDYLADRHMMLIEMHDGTALRTGKFDAALAAGWHVAPTNNSDTHRRDWGVRRGRTGVVAPRLTYHHIIGALRSRRTFATQDENLVLVMRADDYWMGSVIRNGPIHFDVYTFDPDPGDSIAKLELYQNGSLINSIEINTNTFTWSFSLPTLHPAGSWWYVKAIQADGDTAYTSPIWSREPKTHDVMIRDNMWDVGDVPSADPSWQSPDIWVRCQADGKTTHENPVPGQTNYVHARVHNSGLNSLTDIDVYFYWALPSLGPAWPESWRAINSTPAHVPNLAPDETIIVSVPWSVPATAPDHACLFVRLVSAQDPITYEGNAKWDNNIALKNVHIVEIPGELSVAPALVTGDIAFYVTNPFAEDKLANIHLSSREFPARGSLTLHLESDLFDRWMATDTGGVVEGAVINPSAKVIDITVPVDAVVYGLPLQAEQSSAATLALNAPVASALAVNVSEQIDNEEIGGNLFTTSFSREPRKIDLQAAADQVLINRSAELTAVVVGDGFIPVPDGTQVRFSTTLGSLSAATAQTQNGVARVTLDTGTTTGIAIVEAAVSDTVTGRIAVSIYRTCWARLNDTPTDYFTVQAAVDASTHPGDVVKVAGHCNSTNSYSNLAQVVYVGKTLTLRGGYTTTNWVESNPLANPTTLDAEGQGRVLYITGNVHPTVESLRITGGDAVGLGGGPSGEDAGGGVYVTTATPTMKGDWVFNNTATVGGGVYLAYSNATLINNMVTDNQASGSGSGLFIAGSSPRLRHTTIARNGLAGSLTPGSATANPAQAASDGSGVYVTNIGANSSAVGLTNTILVSHSVGLSVTAGNAATLEATLWGSGAWANVTDWMGDGTVNVGAVNIWDGPDFKCLARGGPCSTGPAIGDYHIGPDSAALDAGANAGVPDDIDGDPRYDGRPDLGADELFAALAITKHAVPDRAKAGQHLAYTIHVTNTGDTDLHATIIDSLPVHIGPGQTGTGQPIRPRGTLTWTPVITAPAGTWEQTVDVTVDSGYVGLLTNTVQITTHEAAQGIYTHTSSAYIEKLHYIPTSVRSAYAALCAPDLLAELDTGPIPFEVALDTAGHRAFVAHSEGVTVIDTDWFRTITTTHSTPTAHGIAYDADHNRIWVTRNKADRVAVLDGATYALVADLPTGDEPHSVAYNPGNGRVYVTNYQSWTVSVYDADTMAHIAELTDFAEPAHLAVNSVTNKIFVANHRPGNNVTVINGATHSTYRIPTGLIDAYGVAVDTTRNLVYVTAIAQARISIIDANTDTELGYLDIRRDNSTRVPLRVIAVNPGIGPEGHLLFVTSSEDGGRDQVLLIPNGWPTLGRPVPLDVASYPLEGIALDPNADRAWVTSVGSGLVSVVQDGERICPSPLAANEENGSGFEIEVVTNP